MAVERLKPGPRKPIGCCSVAASIAASALLDLGLDLVGAVAVQPRLVLEGMVADLMAGAGDALERASVAGQGRVLADDEEGDLQPELVEHRKDARDDEVEEGRQGGPRGIAPRA